MSSIFPQKQEQPTERIVQLRERWKTFSFPLQMLLEEHLKWYGLEATQHAILILEQTLAQQRDERGRPIDATRE
jgi:hypothetical protein